MIVLLPPSETKRDGGEGPALDLRTVGLPSLAAQRGEAVDALVRLSADPEAAARVLKLGPRQRGEVDVNARLRTAPTLPAADRYTGVLYDALAAGALDRDAREWLGAHVLIHSAPLGPVRALDPIPSYRLSASTRLPGLPPARRFWAEPTTRALRALAPRYVLDLRSQAYVALGPVPDDLPHDALEVVAEGEGGQVRALNHFNKKAKGLLVSRLAQERPPVGSRAELLDWARGSGMPLRERAGRLELVDGGGPGLSALPPAGRASLT